mgnify:CR=1 FL=1
MGTFKRKSKQSLSIIILLIIAIILIILSIIFIYYKTNKLENNFTSLTKNLNNIKEDYNKIFSTNEELKSELDKLNNIDDSIKNDKEELFKLASSLEQKITKKETKYKIAYLTFDDGPYYTTNKYLDILKKYKVKATFFTIGLDKEDCYDNRSKDCSVMYKKIVDNGHTIANHTYSHLIWKGLYSSADSFINQVKKQEDLIKKKTGVTTNIVRFPGGSSTANAFGIKSAVTKKLKANKYGWVDWSAQDGDGGGIADKDKAFKNLKDSIDEDIEVVLMHDYSQTTLAILPQIIEYLESKNYILLPLFYESIKVNK